MYTRFLWNNTNRKLVSFHPLGYVHVYSRFVWLTLLLHTHTYSTSRPIFFFFILFFSFCSFSFLFLVLIQSSLSPAARNCATSSRKFVTPSRAHRPVHDPRPVVSGQLSSFAFLLIGSLLIVFYVSFFFFFFFFYLWTIAVGLVKIYFFPTERKLTRQSTLVQNL